MPAYGQSSSMRFCGGAVGAAAAFILAAPAGAQNALGDGQILDANPLVGVEGRNFRGFSDRSKNRSKRDLVEKSGRWYNEQDLHMEPFDC